MRNSVSMQLSAGLVLVGAILCSSAQSADLLWRGAAGNGTAAWDLASAWVLNDGTFATPATYVEGDTVTFDDTANGTGDYTVSAGTRNPGLVTVNTTTRNVTITTILGPTTGAIVKSAGTTTLALNAANTFVSTITINGGTLSTSIATGFGATGATSLITLAGGTTLRASFGSTTTTGRSFSLGNSNVTFDMTAANTSFQFGNVTHSISGTAPLGTTQLTKIGLGSFGDSAGTATNKAATPYPGDTVVLAGSIRSLGDVNNQLFGTGTVFLGDTSGTSSVGLVLGGGLSVSAGAFANPIVVRSGSSGTAIISTSNASTTQMVVVSNIELQKNLTITGSTNGTGVAGFDFRGVISGIGGLTVQNGNTTATTNIQVITLSGLNTFTGTLTAIPSTNGSVVVATPVIHDAGPNGLGMGPLVIGNGTLTRTATVRYTGTVAATIGKAITLGDTTTNVLDVSSTGVLTVASVFSGAGRLTKNGTGTIVLNTPTGPATLTQNAGLLQVTGPISTTASIIGGNYQVNAVTTSTVTVNTGATLSGTGTVSGFTLNNGGILLPGLSTGSGIGTLSSSGDVLFNTGGVATFQLSATNDRLAVNSPNTTFNGNTITLQTAAGFVSGGTYTIVTTTGTFTNAASLVFVAPGLNVTPDFTDPQSIKVTVVLKRLTWAGGSGTDLATPANWVPALAPNDPSGPFALTFPPGPATGTLTNTLPTTTVSALIFTGGDYSLTGTNGFNILSNENGIVGISVANGTDNINLPISFSGNAPTISVGIGSALNLLGTVANGGLTQTYDLSGPATLNGVISGAGGLTKNGTATLALGNAANTATGPITINNGMLTFAAEGSLNTATTGIFLDGTAANPAILSYIGTVNAALTKNITLGANPSGNIIDINTAPGIELQPGIANTVNSSAAVGTIALIKTGAGVFGPTATGTQAQSNMVGDVIIKNGALRCRQDTAPNRFLGTGTIFLGDTVGSFDTTLLSGGSILGNALANKVVVQAGNTGVATLKSSNTGTVSIFSGPIELHKDVIVLGGFGINSGVSLTGVISEIVAGRSITIRNDANGGVTTGTTQFFTLGAQNSYTGTTTLLNNGPAFGHTPGTNGSYTTQVTCTIANAIPPMSAVVLNAGTVLTLGNFNQSVGSIAGTGGTINAGTGNTATLITGNDNTSTTFSATINATGTTNLNKVGSGTLTFTANHAALGFYQVSSGTLLLNGTIASPNVIIGDGLGGAGVDTLMLGAATRLPATAVVTIDRTSGNFDLNNFAQTVKSIADVGTGTGSTIKLGSANLTFGDATPSLTLSANVSGGGTLIKAGTGTVSLNGVLSQTATTVSAGTLLLNGTGSTNVTATAAGTGGNGTYSGSLFLNANTAVTPGSENAVGTLTVESLTANSTTQFNYTLDVAGQVGGTNDLIVTTGNLALAGSVNVTAGANFGSGTYRLFNYGGVLTGTIAIAPVPGGMVANVDTSTPGQVNLIITNSPANLTWTGLGDGVNWNNANNWTPVAVPSDSLVTQLTFPDVGAAAYVANNNMPMSPFRVNALIFTGARANSISGGDLQVGGVNATVSFVTTDAVSIPNNIALANNTSVTYAGTLATLSGVISGSSSLTKLGVGTWTMSNALNTYIGGTNLFGGTLIAPDVGVLGAGGNLTIGGTQAGQTATLRYTGPNATLTRPLFFGTQVGAATIELAPAVGPITLTLDSPISGGAAATQIFTLISTSTPVSTLATAAIASTYSGHVVVDHARVAYNLSHQAGFGTGVKTATLQNGGIVNPLVTSDPAAGSISFVFTPSGGEVETPVGVTLTLNDANQFQGTNAVITKNGPGTWSIGSKTNSYAAFTGTMTINGGTVNLIGKEAFGTATTNTLTLNTGALLSLRDNSTASDTIVPNFGYGLTVLGNATVDVRRVDANLNNTITLNSLAINASTLTVTGADGYKLQITGATTLNGSATFAPGSAPLTLTGAVTENVGPFNLIKAGTGTLVLDGTNTFTGGLLINDGTLLIGAGGSIAASVTTVAAAGTLGGVGTLGAIIVDGTVSPGIPTALNGVGTLTVGAATFNAVSSLIIDINSMTLTDRDVLDLSPSVLSIASGAKLFIRTPVFSPSDAGDYIVGKYASSPSSTPFTVDQSLNASSPSQAAFVLYNTGVTPKEIRVKFNSNPTPATVDSVTAMADGAGVLVEWKLVSEFQNAGFNVQRRAFGSNSEDWRTINPALIAGRLTDASAKTYQFYDWAAPGSYDYRLETVSLNDLREYHGQTSGPVTVESLSLFGDVASADGVTSATRAVVQGKQAARGGMLSAALRQDYAPQFAVASSSPLIARNVHGEVLVNAGAREVVSDLGMGVRAISTPADSVFSNAVVMPRYMRVSGAFSSSKALKVTYTATAPGRVIVVPQSMLPAGYDVEHVRVTREGRSVLALAVTPTALYLFGPGYADDYTDKDAFFLYKTAAKTQVAPQSGTAVNLFDSPAQTLQQTVATQEFHDVYFDWAQRPYSYAPWFSNKYLTSGGTQTFALQASHAVAAPGRLTVNVCSQVTAEGSSAGHVLQAFVNGVAAGQATWNGGGSLVALTFAIPANALTGGANTVDLVTPAGTGSGISFVHSMTLSYTQHIGGSDSANVSNTSGSAQVIEASGLTSANVWVVDTRFTDRSALVAHQTQLQADGTYRMRFTANVGGSGQYVIVRQGAETQPIAVNLRTIKAITAGKYLATGPAQFGPAVQPLLAARAREGLRGSFVDQEQIFDYYNAGRFGPAGIQKAVRATKPQYLLLVGTTTYDYRNYSGKNIDPMCPTFLTSTTFWAQATSDAMFGDLGRGIPEVRVGRLPSHTAAEAATTVKRILAHTGLPVSGWRASVTADAADQEAGDFATQGDSLINANPETSWTRNYLGVTAPTAPEVTAAMAEAANGDADLLLYIGHGNAARLGKNNPKILDKSLVSAWTGNAVMLSATCTFNWTANNEPNYHSIAMQGLSQPQGGIAASIATTTYMNSEPALAFVQQMLAISRSSNANARWGDTLLRAQQWAATQGANGGENAGWMMDLSRTESLLGDPAMPMFSRARGRTTIAPNTPAINSGTPMGTF